MVPHRSRRPAGPAVPRLPEGVLRVTAAAGPPAYVTDQEHRAGTAFRGRRRSGLAGGAHGRSSRSRAHSDWLMSRRILGANILSNGPEPPYTSTLLTTRTYPSPTGSSVWSKTTVPPGTGHSLTQRRPSSTFVMMNEPPRLPRCLAQPRA